MARRLRNIYSSQDDQLIHALVASQLDAIQGKATTEAGGMSWLSDVDSYIKGAHDFSELKQLRRRLRRQNVSALGGVRSAAIQTSPNLVLDERIRLAVHDEMKDTLNVARFGGYDDASQEKALIGRLNDSLRTKSCAKVQAKHDRSVQQHQQGWRYTLGISAALVGSVAGLVVGFFFAVALASLVIDLPFVIPLLTFITVLALCTGASALFCYGLFSEMGDDVGKWVKNKFLSRDYHNNLQHYQNRNDWFHYRSQHSVADLDDDLSQDDGDEIVITSSKSQYPSLLESVSDDEENEEEDDEVQLVNTRGLSAKSEVTQPSPQPTTTTYVGVSTRLATAPPQSDVPPPSYSQNQSLQQPRNVVYLVPGGQSMPFAQQPQQGVQWQFPQVPVQCVQRGGSQTGHTQPQVVYGSPLSSWVPSRQTGHSGHSGSPLSSWVPSRQTGHSGHSGSPLSSWVPMTYARPVGTPSVQPQSQQLPTQNESVKGTSDVQPQSLI